MVVRRRIPVWASATAVARSERRRTRRACRTTPSFYFAHAHPSDDHSQRHEEQTAGHHAHRTLVEEWDQSECLGIVGGGENVAAEEPGVEDAGERTPCNEAGTEERAATDF